MKNVLYVIVLCGVLSSLGFACGSMCGDSVPIVLIQGGIPPACSDTLIHQPPAPCLPTSNPDIECLHDGVYVPEYIKRHYRLVPPTPEQQQLCTAVKAACEWMGGTPEQCQQEFNACMTSYSRCEEGESEPILPFQLCVNHSS